MKNSGKQENIKDPRSRQCLSKNVQGYHKNLKNTTILIIITTSQITGVIRRHSKIDPLSPSSQRMIRKKVLVTALFHPILDV